MPFFYIIYVVICVLVIALILFQDGKTGGLVSVADNNTVFGAKGATSFLTRVTTVLVGLFFVLDMGLAFYGGPNKSIAADHPTTQGAGEISAPVTTTEGAPAENTTTDADGKSLEVEGTGQFENATPEVFTQDQLPEDVRQKLGLPPKAGTETPATEKKDGENKDNQEQEQQKDE